MTVYAWVRPGLQQESATEFGIPMGFGFVQNGSVVNATNGVDTINVIVPVNAPRSTTSMNHILASGLADALNAAFGLALTDGDIVLFGGAA